MKHPFKVHQINSDCLRITIGTITVYLEIQTGDELSIRVWQNPTYAEHEPLHELPPIPLQKQP